MEAGTGGRRSQGRCRTSRRLDQSRPLFGARARACIARLRTPLAVQRYLNALPYNNEPGGRATLRSFRGVVRHGCAHCLEAALFAAVVLEQHGYPPLVLSFESIDELDHVIFVYRRGGRWGSVARSRDPGLHGRKPVFATPRALAMSYVDPYIDLTGRVTGYAVVDLRVMGTYDWRLADTNVWKVERMLLDYPHRRDSLVGPARQRAARAIPRVQEGSSRTGSRSSIGDRERWTELPRELGNWYQTCVSRDRSRASAW